MSKKLKLYNYTILLFIVAHNAHSIKNVLHCSSVINKSLFDTRKFGSHILYMYMYTLLNVCSY